MVCAIESVTKLASVIQLDTLILTGVRHTRLLFNTLAALFYHFELVFFSLIGCQQAAQTCASWPGTRCCFNPSHLRARNQEQKANAAGNFQDPHPSFLGLENWARRLEQRLGQERVI
ncbi:hypothetical protein PGT21_010568 [Puccinia graminis f. sp. tritici]|uniref:Uncharacterized protein n=1 Tax=Puccinia graminis f. sp. tritici TaxID=56615 RepID=A0A5B0PNJ9_PUCGR|nr:hypothetical protein PGT21_010568 [Puccinia graminis f. sp. tritici]